MERFARMVLGFHGTSDVFADEILTGKRLINDWPPSKNKYDWLGEGIYFWEHAPERALRWAKAAIAKRPHRYPAGAKPAVIGAVIQISPCFDLTDLTATEMLSQAYPVLKQSYDAASKEFPTNHGSSNDLILRDLDCLMINWLLKDDATFKTVRGSFQEGDDCYPGAMIKKESHIQIAVRDPSCVLGVFRPNF